MRIKTAILLVCAGFCIAVGMIEAQTNVAAATGDHNRVSRDATSMLYLNAALSSLGGESARNRGGVNIQGTLQLALKNGQSTVPFSAKVSGYDYLVRSGSDHPMASSSLHGSHHSLVSGQRIMHEPIDFNERGFEIYPLYDRWTEFLKSSTGISAPKDASVANVPCWQINLTVERRHPHLGNPFSITVLLRKTDSHLLEVRYVMYNGPAPVQFEVIYGDYADGSIPMTAQLKVNGGLISTSTITSITTGADLHDSDFAF